MKKIIYLDNAATTKVAPEVVEAMLPYFTEYYGNPSSVYELAGISKKAVTEGREKVASVIGANPNDIYFTAGGSESDNWALKATYEAYKSKGNHIITTKIEQFYSHSVAVARYAYVFKAAHSNLYPACMV